MESAPVFGRPEEPRSSAEARKLIGGDPPAGASAAPAGTRAQRLERVEAILKEKLPSDAPVLRVAAPGRVNLIGEHLDYNGGRVFPASIDKSFVGAFQPRDDDKIVIHSLSFAEPVEISLADLDAKAEAGETAKDESWGAYVKAVAQALSAHGVELRGVQGVIDSDVPIGSGLSSSAALELLIGKALSRIAGVEIPPIELVKLAQIAEHDYVGVKCGIMDQFAIGMGKKGCALLLDCQTLEHEPVRMDLTGYKLIIGNTKKKRSLVESAFNQRRAECEDALNRLRELTGQPYAALCHVPPEVFAEHAAALPSPIRERAKHAIEENDRVLRSVEILKEGRPDALARFGQLMNESHQSLRDDYQVSCKELDTMVELAREQSGTVGSRMTGAGFGGCTVSLVAADRVDDFIRDVGAEYQARTGLKPEFYVCSIEDGLSEVPSAGSSKKKPHELRGR